MFVLIIQKSLSSVSPYELYILHVQHVKCPGGLSKVPLSAWT